jgi:hypothetical protein
VDPPLEPQDGRLHSLRPNPQDEPDIAEKLPLSFRYPPTYSPELPDVVLSPKMPGVLSPKMPGV